MRQTRPFRRAIVWRSAWQLLSTLALFFATLTLAARVAEPWLYALLLLPLAGLLVRLFVLQHDCGHASLFNTRRANHLAGHLLSFLTTVPFQLWAAEHRWHHLNQGKLDYRGVDIVNSPMTLEEARRDSAGRQRRERRISLLTVCCYGAWALLVERKFVKDFFMFRPSFIWPLPNRERLRRSIYLAHAGSLAVQLALLWLFGWKVWLLLLLPAAVLAAVIGSVLFWLQHNFEHSYHARLPDWRYERVGLQGSSYLKLPAPLAWFTAHIGLHHVHHLDSGIPNYRLEEARQAIPELRELPALRMVDVKASFHKVFWDEASGKMVAFNE